MAENVFGPLRMNDTGFWPEKLQQIRNRTVAFSYRDNDGLKAGASPAPREHEVESGGAGLYSTPPDYALFLHALLQEKIVKKSTLDQMFTPQLNETQSGMMDSVREVVHDSFFPEFPKSLELNHGLGGAINMEDAPGKRKKGSMSWSGFCNSHWVSSVLKLRELIILIIAMD